MNRSRIITKKRDGKALSSDEISSFVDGFVRGDIPDYQMSALAMAIFFQGMDADETTALTRAMLDSGQKLIWPSTAPRRADKHSTGGVGDKTSLVLAPLLASCGLQVPMISGRGLGTTGGTLDKLESFPGYRTNLSLNEIRAQTEQVGCVITGTTDEIAPADKKLYALRDVTATVASVPLITASIMSKKLSENLDALVLDVKFGSGAFMKSPHEARQLAQSLIDVGCRMGVATNALLTDMNQPLGRMVGNALEVNECIAALEGRAPHDLMTLVEALATQLLLSCEIESTPQAAQQRITEELEQGRALEKFRELVIAQGGDPDAPRPVAPASTVEAGESGFVASMDVQKLGIAVIEMGGGRQRMDDEIDHSVGLEMLVRVGEMVQRGQPLVRVFSHEPTARQARLLIEQAITIGCDAPDELPLIA